MNLFKVNCIIFLLIRTKTDKKIEEKQADIKKIEDRAVKVRQQLVNSANTATATA